MSREGTDPGTVRKIASYLFDRGKGETDPQFLQMRTDIGGREMFTTLTYYGILNEEYGSKAAEKIGAILGRLLISVKRMGRTEGVATLQQRFPKVETIMQGFSELLKTEAQEK